MKKYIIGFKSHLYNNKLMIFNKYNTHLINKVSVRFIDC